MKKSICIILASIMIVCLMLTGCAQTPASSSGSAAPAADTTDTAAYVFTYNSVAIPMDAPAAPIVAQLGEPLSYFESESCAFEGIDKTYTYQSFVLNTYPKDGVDYVSSVRLTNDTVSTAEGIYIGSTLDSVNAAYSGSFTVGETGCSFKAGNMTLSFILDAATGNVTSIKYSSNIAQ
ncbi:MAG: hypothetical protein IJP10_04375 [Clostridia bacterium]|nr:hypothetical protein [Oscillospiraceae bacterium]MBQ6797233.1 hypothetical protein [Clostridia bacterium]